MHQFCLSWPASCWCAWRSSMWRDIGCGIPRLTLLGGGCWRSASSSRHSGGGAACAVPVAVHLHDGCHRHSERCQRCVRCCNLSVRGSCLCAAASGVRPAPGLVAHAVRRWWTNRTRRSIEPVPTRLREEGAGRMRRGWVARIGWWCVSQLARISNRAKSEWHKVQRSTRVARRSDHA